MAGARVLLVPLLILLFFSFAAESRMVGTLSTDLVSDGSVGQGPKRYDFLLHPAESTVAASSCKQTYGFLPCTTTVLGNLFLLIVYGYLMFLAAKYISEGSELLLQILGPGIVGGLFLPVLGALPDALVILGSGVTTDNDTSIAARIMVLSVIPFFIVQLSQALNHASWARASIIISLIAAVIMLISYCLYQVFAPWIQKRRLAYANYKYFLSTIFKQVCKHPLGVLLDYNGQPDKNIMLKLFHAIDHDKDNYISHAELRACVIGLQFDNIDLGMDEATEAAARMMEELDSSHDSRLDEEEFIKGHSDWLHHAKEVISSGHGSTKSFDKLRRHAAGEVSALSDEATESFDHHPKVYLKAGMLLILGTVIAAIFADPLVDAVDNFSSAASIPSFFVSFIAMPLAISSSDAVSALIFASRKNQRTASLAFSEIYGSVAMTNLLCLAVFLALVYIRGTHMAQLQRQFSR